MYQNLADRTSHDGRTAPILPFRVAITRIGEPSLAEVAFTRQPLNDPAAVVHFWRTIIADDPSYEPDKEHLVSVLLNTRNFPMGYNLVAIGSLTECISHPREILRACVVSAAYGFILCHNHPSGDASASEADRRITSRIREAAELLQIKFTDHIIVGDPSLHPPGYFSFREAGTL